jgi:hypothetical protein
MKTGEDSGAAIKGRHVSWLIFLTTIMHAGRYHVPAITHASSGYKSQRRDQIGGGETQEEKNKKQRKENRGEAEEKKKENTEVERRKNEG